MKLAQWLMLKKDLDTQIASIFLRIQGSFTIEEGEKSTESTESTEDLLNLYNEKLKELFNVKKVIAYANNTIHPDPERPKMSLADFILARDVAKRLHNSYETLFRGLSNPYNGYGNRRSNKDEIKYVPTIDPEKIRSLVNSAAAEWRALDVLIQQTNWTAELTNTPPESAPSEGTFIPPPAQG